MQFLLLFLMSGIKRRHFFESRLSKALFHCSPVRFLRFGVYFSLVLSKAGYNFERKIPKPGENFVSLNAQPCSMENQVINFQAVTQGPCRHAAVSGCMHIKFDLIRGRAKFIA